MPQERPNLQRNRGPVCCPPEECYPGGLTDGRGPIAASAEGANRGEKGAFSETPSYAVCETALVDCARSARLWADDRFL